METDFDLNKYVRDNQPVLDAKPPKMFNIALQASQTLTPTPVFACRASDNLMSLVYVSGSFDTRESWPNGIKENSRYFRFSIIPKGRRYYNDGDTLTVELEQGYKLKKFRKYTGPLDKILAKINEWIAANNTPTK
jgi:hypothetical protein